MWGRNEEGQLGLGDRSERHLPAIVSALLPKDEEDDPQAAQEQGLKKGKVVSIACGGIHSAAIVRV